MMNSHSCRNILTFGFNKVRCIFGGDVFKHNFQFRHGFKQRLHGGLDKRCFPVKDINVITDHFAMDKQGHAYFLHNLEYRIDFFNITDTVRGVGGGIGRIEFGSGKNTRLVTAFEFFGINRIGEVGCH